MIRADHPLLRAAVAEAGGLSNRRHLQLNPHWSLTIPERLDDFYQSKSAKHRSNLRAAMRKLKREFQVEVKEYAKVDQLEELFACEDQIAGTTYQRGLGSGFMADQLTQNVFRLSAEKGLLRSFVLFLDGEPAAFENGMMYKGRYYGHTVGYNAHFARFSVGTFLWMAILEKLIAEGSCREWDFGFGDAEYKRDFCNNRWLEAVFCAYARSRKGAALKLGDWLTFHASSSLRRLVRLWGAEGRIRRVWRERLRQKEQKRHSQ
jgi:CelD/BcsL family acetyltransferase involved in cellulose biosynthesis